MKKTLLIVLGIILGLGGSVFAATTVFHSNQLAPSPVNFKVLQTNGTDSAWVATSTLGLNGGSGTPGGSSGQLQYNGSGSFAGVSTTTASCTGSASCSTFTVLGSSPITISASGGGAAFPFTATGYGVSTSTTVGFLNGLLSTASSTFTSSVFLPSITNSFLTTNAVGQIVSTTTTSIALADLQSDGTVSFVTGDGKQVLVGTTTEIGINLGKANTWTALQTFNNATSTLFSATYASTTNLYTSTASTTSLSINNVAQYAFKTPGFTYATSTAWTATTTLQLPSPYTNQTINSVQCYTDAGTLNADIYHTTTHLAMDALTTSVTIKTFSTNNTMTAGEKWYVAIGTPATSPMQATCTFNLSPTGF